MRDDACTGSRLAFVRSSSLRQTPHTCLPGKSTVPVGTRPYRWASATPRTPCSAVRAMPLLPWPLTVSQARRICQPQRHASSSSLACGGGILSAERPRMPSLGACLACVVVVAPELGLVRRWQLLDYLRRVFHQSLATPSMSPGPGVCLSPIDYHRVAEYETAD